MKLGILVHVVSAALGLITGAVALSAAKGSRLHRGSGRLFVYTMLAMALSGAVMAVLMDNQGNLIAGLLTAYLVTTGYLTVRARTVTVQRVEAAAAALALVLGAFSVALGFDAFASPRGTRGGIPFVVFFIFGGVALLSALGDIRRMRSGRFRGVPRLSRHIWRMCYALWIAAASFFHGPRARVAMLLPEPLIHPLLLALPGLLVLGSMIYWLWRIRPKRSAGAPLLSPYLRATE